MPMVPSLLILWVCKIFLMLHILVYRDFFYYKGGIYHHTAAAMSQNNPDPHFEETNHAVLAVGWGVSNQGEKYWIVKNSWVSKYLYEF